MASTFSVGLTGGVGSGKSTIASMLLECGAALVDADAIAHQLTSAGGAAIGELRQTFGSEAINADGSLNRDRMRSLAFSDVAARKRLESLLHPMIGAAMRSRASELAVAAPYVVFVVPLLVESGNWRSKVDRVLLIDCSEATQIGRVTMRAGIDENIARQVMGAQATRQQRLDVADDVLVNEAPLDQIKRSVQCLHQSYLRCAESSRPRETL